MVTVIKRGAKKQSITALLKKAMTAKGSSGKVLNAYQYCGVVKFKEDGLTLQKRWRNEWE